MKLRIFLVVLTAIYIALFYYIYAAWGQRYWYLGLSYNPSASLIAVSCTLSLGYITFSRIRHHDIGSFLVEAHFLIIIMPALLVFAVQDYPYFQQLALILCLFSVQVLLRFIVTIRITRLQVSKGISPRTMRYLLVVFSVLLLGYVVVGYGPYMRLHAIDDVHEARALVAGAVSLPLIGYAMGFLQTTAAPTLVAVGIHNRRWLYAFLGIMIVVSVYMAVGAKLALAQLLLTIIMSFWIRDSQKVTIIPLYVLFVCLLGIVAIIVSTDMVTSYWGNELSAVIFMRSFALQAAQIAIYRDFFIDNPNTYYSHVSVFADLVDYPYQSSLGITIGDFMGAEGKMNANAGIWATDGLAAADLGGLFIAAILFGLVLVYMKIIVPASMTPIAATATIPFLMACGNGSLFTNLLTGGGIFLAFFIRHLAAEKNSVTLLKESSQEPSIS